MLNVVSIIYMLCFAASGFAVSILLFPKDRLVKQILFGLTAGLVMLLWFPVLMAFIMKFTLGAQIAAAVLALVIGVACAVIGAVKGVSHIGRFSIKKEAAMLLTCVPIIFAGVVLMKNHYIVNASNGSLHVGQCTYGDLCMHLGFITSISVQKTFPPMYSILPDTALGYPFLCDSISSTFYTLGSTLRFATILPSVYAFVTVTLGVYLFFEDWFKRNSIAVIATWLFFLGGGFGFFYFFDNVKTYAELTSSEAWENWLRETYGITATVFNGAPLEMKQRLLEGFYNTPTNYVELGLRWVNTIADMLLPQRATLFGWALLFPALQLLRRAVFDGEHKLFICLGVLAGAMPLVHTHSFFALGIISAFLITALLFRRFLRLLKAGDEDEAARKEARRGIKFFALFGVIAVCLAAPQLFGFTFRQSTAGGFLKKHFNWCNESDGWLWFYIKNLGFIFILMFPAFFAAKKDDKLFFGGALLIWALCEFVVFQPNTYDNNKLLFVWFAMTCGLVAWFIIKAWDRLTGERYVKEEQKQKQKQGAKGSYTLEKVTLGQKIACVLVIGMLICSMLLSGVMTIRREYVSGDHIEKENGKYVKKESGYEVVSADLVRLTDWMNDNVAPDATILTATNHNNAVAMLTGRNIVCGSPTFLYFHGVDYSERYEAVRLMYEQPSEYFSRYAAKYGVDYVLIGGWENSYRVDRAYFAGFEPVYRDEETNLVLYKVDLSGAK